MDPSIAESAEQALKGLVILAAIPLVLFAIWADYYGRQLANARKEGTRFDPKIKRERVKLAAAFVFGFELVLFLGSLDLFKFYPKTCSIALTVCILTAGFIQVGLERQIGFDTKPHGPGNSPSPSPQASSMSEAAEAKDAAVKSVGIGFKALGLGLLSGCLYVMTLIFFVKAAAWGAAALQLSSVWSTAFVMGGAAVGIFCGLGLNFALAPWQIKQTLPSKAMTTEERATVHEPLDKATLGHFETWVIEDGTFPTQSTALVAGFNWGRGIFKPAIFVSRRMMNALSGKELSAVVAHEAAHVLAKHMRKRIALSAGLITSLTFAAIFCTLTTYTLFSGFPGNRAPAAGAMSAAATSFGQPGVGIFFGIMAFVLTYFVLQKQLRKHEFQADWIAIHKLGADFESWSTALRKIDQLNGFPPLRGALSSHPKTEVRIQNVAKMIEFFNELKKAEAKTGAEKPGSSKDHVA